MNEMNGRVANYEHKKSWQKDTKREMKTFIEKVGYASACLFLIKSDRNFCKTKVFHWYSCWLCMYDKLMVFGEDCNRIVHGWRKKGCFVEIHSHWMCCWVSEYVRIWCTMECSNNAVASWVIANTYTLMLMLSLYMCAQYIHVRIDLSLTHLTFIRIQCALYPKFFHSFFLVLFSVHHFKYIFTFSRI